MGAQDPFPPVDGRPRRQPPSGLPPPPPSAGAETDPFPSTRHDVPWSERSGEQGASPGRGSAAAVSESADAKCSGASSLAEPEATSKADDGERKKEKEMPKIVVI